MFRVSITIEIGRPGKNREYSQEIQILTRESWRRVKALVRKRDDATCKYCGRFAPDGEPDHMLPLSRGGTDALDNLAWCCPMCNSSKGGKTVEEWEAAKPSIPALGSLPYTLDELTTMTDEEQAEVFRRYPSVFPPVEIRVMEWDNLTDEEREIEREVMADMESQMMFEVNDDD